MNYKTILIFATVLFILLGFSNWPYWQAILFPEKTGPAYQMPKVNQGHNEEDVKYSLAIPSLKISVPIQFPNSKEESEIQKALQNGVAHYAGTALPGETGNVYIVGHSSDNVWAKGNYKNIFANLPKLKKGDKIDILSSHKTWTYEIFETKVISPKDLSVLKQPQEKKLLTLQTSYPLGTSLRRYIVIAALTD